MTISSLDVVLGRHNSFYESMPSEFSCQNLVLVCMSPTVARSIHKVKAVMSNLEFLALRSARDRYLY